MPAKHSFRPHPSLRPSAGGRVPRRDRRIVLVALATAIAVLGLGATTSLAATGSVYYDSNFNVGAGHDFFGGTTPTGGSNVGVGYSVMPNLTMGVDNTAIGRASLRGDTAGLNNTAAGYFALADNTVGIANTATGSNALARNTQGQFDTASGYLALRDNTTGVADTATGDHALLSNKNGTANTATGSSALISNKSGNDNTATGLGALSSNTTGADNTAEGLEALSNNKTGHDNVASGTDALSSNTTGSSNLALGSGGGKNLTTGSNNIDIANGGVAGESGTIRIGTSKQIAVFLQGVYGKAVGAKAKAVVVNNNGRLGTAPAPATPALKSQSRSETLGGLRDKVHRQSVELRHQGAAIQRLRKQMRNGG